MLLGTFLHRARPKFEAGSWDSFEHEADRLVRASLSENQRAEVWAIDLQPYETDLATMFTAALAQASEYGERVRALYWEFDPENGWYSSLHLCTSFTPDDPGWAGDSIEWQAGPSQPDLSRVYRQRGQWDTPSADATAILAYARTFGSLGRAYEKAGRSHWPLGATVHDSGRILILPPSPRVGPA